MPNLQIEIKAEQGMKTVHLTEEENKMAASSEVDFTPVQSALLLVQQPRIELEPEEELQREADSDLKASGPLQIAYSNHNDVAFKPEIAETDHDQVIEFDKSSIENAAKSAKNNPISDRRTDVSNDDSLDATADGQVGTTTPELIKFAPVDAMLTPPFAAPQHHHRRFQRHTKAANQQHGNHPARNQRPVRQVGWNIHDNKTLCCL